MLTVKDKTAILLELDDLKLVRDELTEDVGALTTELEKERSKSKRSDHDRPPDKPEKSEKQEKHDKHDRAKVTLALTAFLEHFCNTYLFCSS